MSTLKKEIKIEKFVAASECGHKMMMMVYDWILPGDLSRIK